MMARHVTTILREILKLLSKDSGLTFRRIQFETKTQWRTLTKCLDFLLDVNLIKKKRLGNKKNSPRMFSLK